MRFPTLIASSIECVTKRIVIIVLLQAAVKRSQEASTPEHTSPERARSGSRRQPFEPRPIPRRIRAIEVTWLPYCPGGLKADSTKA